MAVFAADAASSFATGIDAGGAREGIQGYCSASIGAVDGQEAGPLTLNYKPGDQPE